MRRRKGRRPRGRMRRKMGRRRRRGGPRQTCARMGRTYYIADSTMVKMNLFDRGFSTLTAGTVGGQTYSGNSIALPIPTVTGTQPSAFDQFAAFYSRFRVFGSSIRVTLINQTANNVPITMIIYPSADPALSATQIGAVNQPRSKERSASIFQAPPRIKHYISTSTMLGLKNLQPKVDDDLAGVMTSVTGSPSQQWYWQVFIQASDITNNCSFVLQVQLNYYCKLFSRKFAVAS